MASRGIGPCGILLAAWVVLALGASPSLAGPAVHRGSVRVGPVRVEAPGLSKDTPVSVTVAIGERRLWTSRQVPAPRATWPVRFRAFTSRNAPLVFRVSSGAGSPARPGTPSRPGFRPGRRSRSVHDQDATLASALPDLVSDYGTGTLDDPGEPRGRVAAGTAPGLQPASKIGRASCRERV